MDPLRRTRLKEAWNVFALKMGNECACMCWRTNWEPEGSWHCVWVNCVTIKPSEILIYVFIKKGCFASRFQSLFFLFSPFFPRQHETVIPSELPLGQELTSTLREWAVIWHKLYVVSFLQWLVFYYMTWYEMRLGFLQGILRLWIERHAEL